jgi:nucleotide-binding universal stress UspA family protein
MEILEGDPARVIVSRAESDPTIWTIVMATRGVGTDRSFNRSVTEKVLRTSVPILLVHPDERMDSLRRFYRRAYQTILVPLDGTALAEQALAPASVLAGAMGASLLLLSVIPVPHVGEVGRAMHMVHTMDTLRAAEETGDPSYKGSEAGDGDRLGQGEQRGGYLSKTAEALRSSGLAVRAEVAYGAPAEEISRFAADARAGLIVMSICCRSDLRCLLGGSVVRKVTQDARLPVLLVRAQMAACQEQRRQGRQREQRNEELAVMSSTTGVVAPQVPARL